MKPASQVPSTSSTLREVRIDAYRRVLLDAAEPVFAAHGYEAARVQDIAEASGVSVGTIYGVFGSKAELFAVVLTHRLPELLEAATTAGQAGTSTVEQLVHGLDTFLRFMLQHPDWLRIHLREHAWGMGPTRADREQIAAWREGMHIEAAILSAAMDEGAILRQDPVRLARVIAAFHQVHLSDWIEDGMVEPPDEVVARLRGLFVHMFCVPPAAT